MKIYISLITLFLIAFTSCKKRTMLTQDEVVAVIKRFDDGWKKKNLAEVDSVLAPAYVYFTQSGGTFSRDSVVQTAGSATYSLERVDRSDFIVQLSGNTAVVSTRWKGKGIYKEVPFDEDQRCSITIVKHDNIVEILSEHCTPIKESRVFH